MQSQKQNNQNQYQVIRLGDIILLEYGEGLPEYVREDGRYPVFGSNGIVGYHNKPIVKGPGIIIGRKGSIGEVTWCDSDFWPIDTTYYVKTKTANISLKWLFYLLSHLKLKNLNTATSIPGLNRNDVYLLKCMYPPFIEQEKVASILSRVDELIQKIDGMIEQTQRLKKAVMKKLLAEGIGHRKFKKAKYVFGRVIKIPEEWKIVKVNEITQSVVPGRNKPKRFNGDIPWITIQDIDGLYVSDSRQALRITKEEMKKNAGKSIPPQSVIMTCVGEFGIVSIATREMVLNQQLHALFCSDNILPEFLAISLMMQKDYMYSIATTTTIPYMNKDNCESIPIVLPPILEQQKITTIVSLLESCIEKDKQCRIILTKIKVGLMQKLLTGEIRVKV